MALWDIIEKIFNIGVNVGSKVIERAEDQYFDMQDKVDKLEKYAGQLTDEQLKTRFKSSDGWEKSIYGRELKNRGY